MRIDHLAIWTFDLEKMKYFYEKYFGGKAGSKYHNPNKNFTSYFISFSEGSRLELMHKPEVPSHGLSIDTEYKGLAHFAISLASKEAVDALTKQLATDGYTILGEARTTGDGYYESVVLDPEGNRIEITI